LASNTTLSAPRVAATRWSVRLTGVVGWVLVGCGAGVLLYLAYALLFTNIGAERAQSQLREQWQRVEAVPHERDGRPVAAAPAPDVPGVALLEFARPGRSRPLIADEPLVVLDGVTSGELAQGPGHYPDSAPPGGPGNFSVAGHRTTYGAPFFHVDQLRPGDQILVTDRDGTRHTYEVRRQHIVAPSETWVIGPDPLRTGEPTMTLTTCNPRFSAAQRLVVHAELVS